jgi:tetratricopeptide (TPR) repeat protein
LNPPLLTIAIGVRNDNYVKNYAWRISTVVNYIVYGLEKIGRLTDVEILISDWNSPTPMANELPLSNAAREITRFFDVPAEIAIPAQKGSPYPYGVVWNSAVRRASGQFVGMSDNDSLYTSYGLDFLLKLLEGSLNAGVDLSKALMATSRRQVRQDLTLCFPSVVEIDQYLNLYATLVDEDRLQNGILGAVGTYFMHRDLWDELGGMDEREVNWGWLDIDLALRATRKYPWVNLSNFGVTVFHMGHPPNWLKGKSKEKKKKTKTSTHEVHYPFLINPNGKDWGQGRYDLPVYAQGSFDKAGLFPKNSQMWRLNQLQNLSPCEIEAQIFSSENRAVVNEFLEKAAAFLFVSTATEVSIRQSPDETCYQWNYIDALSWYSRCLMPLTFLDASIGQGLPVSLVSMLFPVVSLYGFETWSPADNPLSAHPVRLMKVLELEKHRGYLRFVSDQSLQSYRQFFENPDSPQQIDLIYYGNSSSPQKVYEETRFLLSHLSPGGCFVLRHLKKPVLASVTKKLQKEFESYTWLLGSSCAVALRTSMKFIHPVNTEAKSGVDLLSFPENQQPKQSFTETANTVQRLMTETRIEEAVLTLQEYINANPDRPDAYLLMGNILIDKKLHNNTRYYYEKCIELDPDSLAGYLGLCRTLIALGDSDAGEQTLRSYLNRCPNNPRALKLLGDLLFDLERLDEAFEIYCSLITMNPNDVEALFSLSQCSIALGDLCNAQMLFTRLNGIQPGIEGIGRKMDEINQRILAASEAIQEILSSDDIFATFEKKPQLLSPDVIYLLFWNANQAKNEGNQEMAEGLVTLATSMQNLCEE